MEKFPRARAAAETFLKDEDLQMSLALDGVNRAMEVLGDFCEAGGKNKKCERC